MKGNRPNTLNTVHSFRFFQTFFFYFVALMFFNGFVGCWTIKAMGNNRQQRHNPNNDGNHDADNDREKERKKSIARKHTMRIVKPKKKESEMIPKTKA